MIIALASPRIASSLDEGLDKIKQFLSEASGRGAEIVCFPEAYLPGLRGQGLEVFPFALTQQELALRAVAEWARECGGHDPRDGKDYRRGPADRRLRHRCQRPGSGL